MKHLHWGRVWFAALVVFAVVAPASASDHVLNPTTFRSASGHYELFVSPSASNGSGPAFYRMTLDGMEVWAGERPFSLWGARLTNSGRVAGYAYEGGASPPGHHGIGYSKLTVCFLGTDGEVLQRDSSKAESDEFRVTSFVIGNSPHVYGTLLDEEGDRFILRVPRSEWRAPVAWWIYRLTTGEFLETVTPDQPAAAGVGSGELGLIIVLTVKRIPETPFVVVHWYLDDGSDELQGRSAKLSVLGLDGKQLWIRDFPGEYGGEEKYLFTNAYEKLSNQLLAEPGSFSFNSFRLGQLLSFSVEPDSGSASGWRVAETRRTAVSPEPSANEVSSAEVETIELEELEPIRLKRPSGKGQPIARISDFVIDGDGSFAFVGSSSLDEARFIRVTQSGEVLSDISLDALGDFDGGDVHLAPTLNGRWFLVQNGSGELPRARAWFLDPVNAELVEIEHFASSIILSMAPTEDGGFVALSARERYSFGAKTVERFDRDGMSIWKWNSRDVDPGQDFDAITWLPGVGAVALAGKVNSSLTYFSLTGVVEEKVELADLFEQKLNYATGLRAGRDGGLLVYDFEGEPSCFVIDSKRKGARAWTPRLADGRSIPIVGEIQAAPDGSLWTSDGQAFLRLSDDGVVDKVVRPLASGGEGGFEEIWTVDSKGQIYTFNPLTAEVRVYASDGSYLHACKTESADYEIRIEIHGISVDGQGRVFVHLNNFTDNVPLYLVFSATGERIGWKQLELDSISENWLLKTGTGGLWVLGYEEIFLLDANDQLIKTILRRANGDWLQYTEKGAVAADGSLAVIAGPLGLQGERRPAVVSIYDGSGEPLLAWELQEEGAWARLAFNGKKLVIADEPGVFLYELDGTPPKKYVPRLSDEEEHWFTPFFSPDGTELWLAGIEPGEIRRYRL